MGAWNTNLVIPDDAWTDDSPDDSPGLRLLAQVKVNGVPFHAHAFLCFTDENGKDEADAIYTLNDQAMQTVTIHGREYIVVIYPHGV